MLAYSSLSGFTSPVIPFITCLLGAIAFLSYKSGCFKKSKRKAIIRVLFNKRHWLSQSSLLDFQYVFAGKFLFTFAIIYTTFTGTQISDYI